MVPLPLKSHHPAPGSPDHCDCALQRLVMQPQAGLTHKQYQIVHLLPGLTSPQEKEDLKVLRRCYDV